MKTVWGVKDKKLIILNKHRKIGVIFITIKQWLVSKITRKSYMKLELLRISSQKDSTNGILFDITDGRDFLCYTLEDEARDSKIYQETRIPAGTYNITLRTEGGFHQRYSKKFPDIHQGMLWLIDVPGFEYILIHIGNTDEDTAGCILVADGQWENISRKDGFIPSSTTAYKRIYPKIAVALVGGEEVSISIIDYDTVKIPHHNV